MEIGPDVNLASRIAQLNEVLGEPLLISQAFVDVLPGRSVSLGVHVIPGFEETAPIDRLPLLCAGLCGGSE
jgi:adenylate cyclase